MMMLFCPHESEVEGLTGKLVVRDECENIIGAGAIITKKTEFKGVYLPAQSIKFGKNSDEIKL